VDALNDRYPDGDACGNDSAVADVVESLLRCVGVSATIRRQLKFSEICA
jgi:hypothetical protein